MWRSSHPLLLHRVVEHQGAVVEGRLHQRVALLVVVLAVGPRFAVALLRQARHAAANVAGSEIVRVDVGLAVHALIRGAQARRALAHAQCVHVLEQTADIVGDHVGAQGPGRADVAECPGEVGQVGNHDAAIGEGIRQVDVAAVHVEVDVAEARQLNAGGDDDDVGLQDVAGRQLDAVRHEALDGVGDHRRLARADRREKVAVRQQTEAFSPRPVAGREVLLHVVAFGQRRGGHADQFLRHHLRLGQRPLRHHPPELEDLPLLDAMDPLLRHVERPQFLNRRIFDAVVERDVVGG